MNTHRARRRRPLRLLGLVLALVVIAASGAGWWFYQRLDGNIRSVSIGARGGTERPDASGRTPVDILVIGSDGRTSAADCGLGGGCAHTGVQKDGGNADVELLVHIAADRSNATVLSIPRDTVTEIPACRDSATGASESGYRGQINSALRYGPACQVAAVHRLTGIPVTHYAQLDFSGVVKMSDAVGGVSVCVSDDVYDTYSHLKLSKGTHTLKGVAALEFLRSRHGFGDGSDLGRTVSQHLFLGAVLRKVKSGDTLTDPAAVYRLADAATKALTVDDGLGSVRALVALAADLNKVPTGRVTFVTMQTDPDPDDTDRVVVAPEARALFADIAGDRSLSAGSGAGRSTPSPVPSSPVPSSPVPSVPVSRIAVRVENGTGITGRAAAVAGALTAQGFGSGTVAGNAPRSAPTTTLGYGPGLREQALRTAAALGLPASRTAPGGGAGLTLVIGADWPSGTTYPGAALSPVPADGATARAHAATADRAGKCAQVGRYRTVSLDGVAMTPSQAYALAKDVPDSDS
ncbi:LCP family protein [Streptomyces violaceorubidus]